MPETNDMALIREYSDRDSESAFADLVHRHIHLVHSVAFRYVGNSPDAQDVTQAVFVILAKKAASLRQRATITGWLYETTRFAASALLRTKSRQQAREHEAYMQSTLNDSNLNEVWRQLAPILEDAMNHLSEKERALLALRFFDNKSAVETAGLLGIRESAAHKRAARALEKLRRFFLKRGINSTSEVIAGAISTNSVQAAPVALEKSVIAVAIAKGGAASSSTLMLVKGALKIMAWAKAKTAVVLGAGALLAAGTAAITVIEVEGHQMADAAGKGLVGNTTTYDSVPVTFESLLTNAPVIRTAEFEIINPPQDPESVDTLRQDAQKRNDKVMLSFISELASGNTNHCWLRLDKANYMIQRQDGGGYGGRMGSVEWELVGNWLKLVDRNYNRPESGWLTECAARMLPVRRLMSLGMPSIIPDTIIWTGADHFVAQCDQRLDGTSTNRGTIDVQLHYINGVPIAATTKDTWGHETEVRYRYDPTFFFGRLPVAYDVTRLSNDSRVAPRELFGLRITKLELSQSPIDVVEFNPITILRDKYSLLIILSNNVPYGISKQGVMRPVLSAEEVEQRANQAKAH
jgi:RNA polymerase sigma factor (sigma-70 family)